MFLKKIRICMTYNKEHRDAGSIWQFSIPSSLLGLENAPYLGLAAGNSGRCMFPGTLR